MDIQAASKRAQADSADVKLVHQRPNIIQELEWRPSPFVTTSRGPDPVSSVVLSFYNGRLFQIVSSYSSYKIEGMTLEDLITSISKAYGVASMPNVDIPFHSNYAETATVLARWDNAANAMDLVRTGDRSSFAVVTYSKQLSALATASAVEASTIEAREAPQRQKDTEKRLQEAVRSSQEKARTENRPNFLP